MRSLLSLILIIAVLLGIERSAEGQQPTKIPRIGLLFIGRPLPNHSRLFRQPFLERFEELGYEQGKNVVIEIRYAHGKPNPLPQLAAELVRLKVSVIVAQGPRVTGYAMKATKTIPIVMAAGGDPISRGFVDSLNRPGGNVTGMAGDVKGLNGKRMELYKEAFPWISRVTILEAGSDRNRAIKHRDALKSLGVNVQIVPIRRSDGIEGTFAKVIASRPDALVTIRGLLSIRNAKKIADFAVKKRLPSMHQSKRFVEVGGLMSYGFDRSAIWGRAAVYVDKILKGADPATLPVEPPRLEFVINLKTAQKIGVTIPPEILLEANEVIK
jgi:putative ABC transport system substrate-binding protein